MFTNETELNAARSKGDLDQVYRRLVELGWHQLRVSVSIGGQSYALVDPTDKRDVIHEAACSLVVQLKKNPTKRVDFWHVNMRYALRDALKRRHIEANPDTLSLDKLQETGEYAHEF